MDFFITDVLRTSFLPLTFTFTYELLVLPPSLAAIRSFAPTTVIVKVPGSPTISTYREIKKMNYLIQNMNTCFIASIITSRLIYAISRKSI